MYSQSDTETAAPRRRQRSRRAQRYKNTTTVTASSSVSFANASSSITGIEQEQEEWNSSKRTVDEASDSVMGKKLQNVVAITTMDFQRRHIMFSVIGILIGNLWRGQEDQVASASQFADMPALRGKDYGKSKMRYPDYSETESGLQYKDLRVGTGPSPKMGETVVIDWDGYTIGYLGRIFEARNKAKGGPFEGGDKEFLKFKLGSQQVIPAFEESLVGMAPGGIRRIIVPPELGYPDNDFNKLGPRPMTFSGQRHLDFVLKNEGLIDKTLLFDIELIKILPN
ncbi:Peptidyl-prolyl cis-trans isomerase fkbp19 [Ranunculus cassubicifolius]